MSETNSSRPPPPGTPHNPPAADPAGSAEPHPAAAGEITGGTPSRPGLKTVAVVLTAVRKVLVGQHTYHVPPGQVIRILTIPETVAFQDGADTKLVPAGTLKLGDQVA